MIFSVNVLQKNIINFKLLKLKSVEYTLTVCVEVFKVLVVELQQVLHDLVHVVALLRALGRDHPLHARHLVPDQHDLLRDVVPQVLQRLLQLHVRVVLHLGQVQPLRHEPGQHVPLGLVQLEYVQHAPHRLLLQRHLVVEEDGAVGEGGVVGGGDLLQGGARLQDVVGRVRLHDLPAQGLAVVPVVVVGQPAQDVVHVDAAVAEVVLAVVASLLLSPVHAVPRDSSQVERSRSPVGHEVVLLVVPPDGVSVLAEYVDAVHVQYVVQCVDVRTEIF